ncbi:MAG: hypothetical protein JWO47_400 [Candidatus Saccharibacteria bacterium]|nr:hypothetical protein [Candidatus Saccharibacteria bacterium]
MTAQEHIELTLQTLKEPIIIEDIGSSSLEDAIYAKVMSKKFRKLKADEDAIAVAKKAIKLSVEQKKPIKFNLIFGGNKLWHFDEAPEIDWAELFATIYLLRWVKSVASVYEYGVEFEFYSEDVVLQNMNNLPKEETDQYSETFQAMLTWLQQYIPSGVHVIYKRYGDDYENEDEYLAELEEAKAKVMQELGGKLPELNEHQRHATELNVRLSPGQADDPLWREKAELIHQSIERTKTMERYIYDPTMIPSSPMYFKGCITTGSTKKSYGKFWVAVGALEPKGEEFSEIILTPKQLAAAEFEWEDVNIEGLPGKNFKKVRILK